MKSKIFILLIVALFLQPLIYNPALAQDDEGNNGFDLTNPATQVSALAAALGYTKIDNQNFIGFRITPTLQLGKLGLGLDVPLMFNLDGMKFRTDEFKDGVGLLRMIRFASWGIKKNDPFYIKVGDISGAYLGFGLFMNNYTNMASFDKRKVGVELDLCIKKFVGLEFMYSNLDFASVNLMGIRPYIRPFGMTRIPVVKTFEIGGTYILDKDQTYVTTSTGDVKFDTFIKDGITAYGGDMGVIFINRSFMQWRAFAQYGTLRKVTSQGLKDSLAKDALKPGADATLINGYKEGTGMSVGTDFKFKFLGNVLRVDARLERLWYSDYFQPQFFDGLYEINKDAKIRSLASTEKKAGIFGSLAVTVLEKIQVSGGLMIPDQVSAAAPAMMQLNLDASKIMEKVMITGTYFKGGLTDLSDALKVDDRSLASLRVGYKMYKFLVIGLDYKWTFTALEDGKFEAASHFSPYFGINLPLNFGGAKTE